MFVVVDLRQHRHVVRALRHHRDVAAPRLPAVVVGLLPPDASSTSASFAGTLGLFFTLFLLFIRWIPMIAIAEVKGVLPEADPHHDDERARRAPRGRRRGATDGDRVMSRRGRVTSDAPKKRPVAHPRGVRHARASACTPPKTVRDAGYKKWDTHTPFPIHGMDAAMGLGDSQARLDRASRSASPGTTLAFAHDVLDERHRLPDHHRRQAAEHRVSRRWSRSCSSSPSSSRRSATVFGMLGLNKLPRHHHPVFDSERFTALLERQVLRLGRGDGPEVERRQDEGAARGAARDARRARLRRRRRRRGPRRGFAREGPRMKSLPLPLLLRFARPGGRARGLPRVRPRKSRPSSASATCTTSRATTSRRSRASSRTTARCVRSSRASSPREQEIDPTVAQGRLDDQSGLRPHHPRRGRERPEGRRHGEARRARPGSLRHLLHALPRRHRQR